MTVTLKKLQVETFPMLTNHLKLKLPSIPENIIVVESFINQIRDIYQLDDMIYGNIIVAVTEAVNNAIVHGNGSSKERIVTIEVLAKQTEVIFSVSDEGKGFNYHDLPDPTSPENLEIPGGRGIYLIKCLADSYSFNNGGTTLRMSFNLNK